MTDYLHHVPGRLRLRSKVLRRDSDVRRLTLRKLRAIPGVHSVRLNHKAGSVTIVYAMEETDMEQIMNHLQHCRLNRSVQESLPQSPSAFHQELSNFRSMVGKMAINMLVSKGVRYSLSTLLGTRL